MFKYLDNWVPQKSLQSLGKYCQIDTSMYSPYLIEDVILLTVFLYIFYVLLSGVSWVLWKKW